MKNPQLKKVGKGKKIALIKKANNLIEARYKFDIWEMRFFLLLLSKIEKDDNALKKYRIWYKDIIKTFGLKTNRTHELIRESVQRLMKRTIVVNVEEIGGIVREYQYNIITSSNLLVHVPQGIDGSLHEYIDVTISEQVKPLLLQLQKSFTIYPLSNVVKLGVYGIRLYELLKQYEGAGVRTMRIDNMKSMFEISEEYPLFANFYQKVIATSVRDINEYTDLQVAEPIKVFEGKSVVALTFNFSKKVLLKELEMLKDDINFPSFFIDNQDNRGKIYTKYEDIMVQIFGVTPTVFWELLGTFDEEQINQAIRITQRAHDHKLVKTSLSGFFVKALKEAYTDPEEAQNKKQIELKEALDARIVVLTHQYPNLMKHALKHLKKNNLFKNEIEQIEQSTKYPLTFADFNQDEALREGVRKAIIALNRIHFDDIL